MPTTSAPCSATAPTSRPTTPQPTGCCRSRPSSSTIRSPRGSTPAHYVVARLGRLGPTVILSDGDVVFQPRKVKRSGLWDAVEGRVLIFIHKERMLDTVQRCYPARGYAMVDDKQRVLTAMKETLGTRLLIVFPRQGHYAHDPANIARYPAADVSIDRIGDLLEVDLPSRLDALQETP